MFHSGTSLSLFFILVLFVFSFFFFWCLCLCFSFWYFLVFIFFLPGDSVSCVVSLSLVQVLFNPCLCPGKPGRQRWRSRASGCRDCERSGSFPSRFGVGRNASSQPTSRLNAGESVVSGHLNARVINIIMIMIFIIMAKHISVQQSSGRYLSLDFSIIRPTCDLKSDVEILECYFGKVFFVILRFWWWWCQHSKSW